VSVKNRCGNSFEVALRVASVAHRVFMTSQLYRCLSALSVLSKYCRVVRACRLPPVIPCDTILMLFRSTSPLGDRVSPPPVRLSVTDLTPQALQASRQSLMGHYGVTIINKRKKLILSKR